MVTLFSCKIASRNNSIQEIWTVPITMSNSRSLILKKLWLVNTFQHIKYDVCICKNKVL